MSDGTKRATTSPPRLGAADESSVVEAIRRAERGNRGEVRVHLEARAPGGDALKRARAVFEQLQMHRTKEGTAVLLYVAVDDRKAAVFAGRGIHGAQGAEFWKSVTDAVADEARDGRLGRGLVAALGLIGKALREKVPGEDHHGNELPDTVTSS